jgi:hypothetical protein
MEINGQFHIPIALLSGKSPDTDLHVRPDESQSRFGRLAEESNNPPPPIWNRTYVLLCSH